PRSSAGTSHGAAWDADALRRAPERMEADMKRVLLGGVVLALAAPSATAADLPRAQPVVKAPVVVPLTAYDWTGFYVGINGGGAWGRSGVGGATGAGGEVAPPRGGV